MHECRHEDANFCSKSTRFSYTKDRARNNFPIYLASGGRIAVLPFPCRAIPLRRRAACCTKPLLHHPAEHVQIGKLFRARSLGKGNRIMKSAFKALILLVVTSSLMVGCAMYEPAPAYGQYPYYQPVPGYGELGYYALPAPVYVQPAPIYVRPPVSLHFSFGHWSSHHHVPHHLGRGGHGFGHGRGGWRR